MYEYVDFKMIYQKCIQIIITCKILLTGPMIIASAKKTLKIKKIVLRLTPIIK